MTTAIKALIFDLDGTLVDSLQDIANACNHALEMVGAQPRSVEDIRSMIGGGVQQLFARALGTEDSSRIDAARKHFAPAYAKGLLRHTRLYPGLETVLDQLKAAGFTLCIATNKPQRFTAPIFEGLGLERWFSSWASADECPAKKPDPAVLQLALQRAELDPDTGNCVYIGDMSVDLVSAQNAGCPSIWLEWGFGSRADVKDCLGRSADSPEKFLEEVLNLEEEKKMEGLTSLVGGAL